MRQWPSQLQEIYTGQANLADTYPAILPPPLPHLFASLPPSLPSSLPPLPDFTPRGNAATGTVASSVTTSIRSLPRCIRP